MSPLSRQNIWYRGILILKTKSQILSTPGDCRVQGLGLGSRAKDSGPSVDRMSIWAFRGPIGSLLTSGAGPLSFSGLQSAEGALGLGEVSYPVVL